MVDSECSVTDGHVSIAEDNEYFKRMWSLVPPSAATEIELAEKEEENLDSAKKRKKNAKKEKKREKHRKKEKNKETETSTKETPKVVKNCNIDDETETKTQATHKVVKKRDIDEDFTLMKRKKPKLNQHAEDSLPVNDTSASNTPATHTPDPVVDLSSKPSIKSSPKHSIPVKKQKLGASKLSVNSPNEQVADQTSTAIKRKPDAAGSGAVLVNDLSDSGTLQAASITGIEDKREKLRAKISDLQAKRQPSNRERLEKKKLKRQESKMKLKQKRKLEKLQNRQNKQNGDVSKPTKGNTNKSVTITTPSKPIFNKEGQMVFSKFDFTDSVKKEKKHSDLGGKDYKRLLEKIERRNEKINKVKSRDEDAGKALENKFKWESVLHKAEGEKVKDNPEMLKKAMKRKQKMKDQRKKKWDGRSEHVDKLKEDKQKKRTENIQKRKTAVKDKKMKKLKKKGRIIPGF